jgi:hypothetical protein
VFANGRRGAASVRSRRRVPGGDTSSPLVMITIPLNARPRFQPHYGSLAAPSTSLTCVNRHMVPLAIPFPTSSLIFTFSLHRVYSRRNGAHRFLHFVDTARHRSLRIPELACCGAQDFTSCVTDNVRLDYQGRKGVRNPSHPSSGVLLEGRGRGQH